MALTTSRPGARDATSPNYSSLLSDLTTSLLGADNRTTAASILLDNMTTFAGNDSTLSDNMSCVFNATINSTVCGSNATLPVPHILPHSIGLTVFLGLLAGVVSLVTILGNITVLLAFGLERTIRQPTNYFLASLAVSDLLIGTFSMPLYSQYLLWGKWPLGPWLCDLWLSLDWTVCLTSQYTVFLITMDRFLSVKIPAKYRNWRTERKVMVMISVTWILPAIVFFTSIVGWQYFVGKRTVKAEACEVQFMEDTMFTFLLTIGYYWITLVVMFILYGGIYKVALDLQRKSDEKHKKMQSTMELAGDNPNAAIRSFGNEHDGGVSNNNSSGGGDSQAPPLDRNNRKSKKKILEHNNSRRSVKTALPIPPGAAQVVNTTSFSTNNKGADKDDDRSSSPAFASDDDNSSSGGAVGTAKSPLTPTVYSGKPHPTGVVNSVLYANTGGLVRSLHGELFFSQPGDNQECQNLLQPPPPYSKLDGKMASDTGSDVEGSQLQEFDSVYSSSASERLEKQTTPLLQNEIMKGCRFIDEKSFMATLSSESAALLPVINAESELDDSDVADLHASSPIWKRRNSLPPLATDVFDLDDDASDCLITTDFTTTTTEAPTASTTPVYTNNKNHNRGQRPRADTANTMTSTTTGADTGTDDSSGNKSSEVTGHAEGHHANNCTNNQPPSDTNEDSGRSDTHCLSAVRRRQNKDTRLHSFVKSVRSRNSRRRNRRERKSKSENRARKALRTISFILGAFVLCWTPYHIAIMVIALCTNCVNGTIYAFSYWMCYLNSPINPFCYAFANAQFKRTFLRIMRFDWHRT